MLLQIPFFNGSAPILNHIFPTGVLMFLQELTALTKHTNGHVTQKWTIQSSSLETPSTKMGKIGPTMLIFPKRYECRNYLKVSLKEKKKRKASQNARENRAEAGVAVAAFEC